VESKFLKIQQHQVAMPSAGKEARTQIIDDWLFIDYHDRINVLVEAPRQSGWTEPHFYVFEQTKYALEDRMSLALVGGIVEPNELPKDAARREVSEEMHLVCNSFYFLGRYRTDVNRGGGWTSTYLARHCKPGKLNDKGLNEADEVGAPDTERQDRKIVSLTALRKAVSEAKFLEIQWSATVALAVLHETLSRYS
jgi:ADP-ribose pyrophosphatase YjhB (NUDIX family)